MSSPPPKLVPEQAEEALTQIYDRFNLKENRERLTALVQECNASENPLAAKMMRFPGVISGMVADIMENHGFHESQMMAGMAQIQMHAAKNPAMSHKVGVLMKAFMGNLEGEEGAVGEEEEAEECD